MINTTRSRTIQTILGVLLGIGIFTSWLLLAAISVGGWRLWK